MAALLFIDSPAGLDEARRSWPQATIATDNPFLGRLAGVRLDSSALLGQAEARQIGDAAIDALLALDRAVAASDLDRRLGLLTPRLNLTMALRATVSTLLHRAVMAARAVAAIPADEVAVLAFPAARWDPASPWHLPRFAHPLAMLADHGFFGTLPATVRPATGWTVPDNPADQSADDLASRILVTPTSILVDEVISRLRLGRGRPLYVGKPSESLRETLPWLRLRGYRPIAFKLPAYGRVEPPAAGERPALDAHLADMARTALAPAAAAAGLAPVQAEAVIACILDHLAGGMAALAAALPALRRSVDALPAGATILTSGIYGPIATQFQAACRARGVAIVDFEHGATTGIACTSERRLDVSEATTCDLLIASSPRAKRSFAAAAHSGAVVAVGLPDQTRTVPRAALQRWHVRRRLGLAGDERMVLHVSGLVYGGNMRYGNDCPVESHVYDMERRFLTEIYPQVPGRVFYKPYPSTRMAYQPEHAQAYGLAPNLRLAAREDFRYIRAAADVIVTEATMSTIGWCAGTGRPLIHLSSRHAMALVDDGLRADFARAFFAVDMDEPGWEDRLLALLRRPPAELAAEWADKADFRAEFLRDALFGPAGCVGRTAAAAIHHFIARSRE